MSEKVFLGRESLPLVWKRRRDDGGMFKATVGVARRDDRFVAFVMSGWGGGVSCTRDTREAAEAEIDRLWERLYG